MCELLEVSRSGFYDWLHRPKSKRKLETEQIALFAAKRYQELSGICGLDKILRDVREKHPKCSRNRLYKIQKATKLYSVRKKKYKATTNSNHKLLVAENILNQDFYTKEPNTVWVTDISYIATNQGWLYL